MEKEANKINSAEERCHSTVPECFREPLMKVAYKLLSRDKATFEELTPSEQKLWTSFENDQIYRLLTGEPDTVPEFQFNSYTVTGGGATAEFIPAQSSAPSATLTAATRPSSAIAIQPATISASKAKVPKASTSAAPSSTLSPPSTVPSSPNASTSGTVPKPAAPPRSSRSLTTSSQSSLPPVLEAPVSTRQLRPHRRRTLTTENFPLGKRYCLDKENF